MNSEPSSKKRTGLEPVLTSMSFPLPDLSIQADTVKLSVEMIVFVSVASSHRSTKGAEEEDEDEMVVAPAIPVTPAVASAATKEPEETAPDTAPPTDARAADALIALVTIAKLTSTEDDWRVVFVTFTERNGVPALSNTLVIALVYPLRASVPV